MNENWLEEFDVPIGPDNHIEPGGPDQGQPTHFYPRRSPFLFTIRVPSDFGNKELIWTLTTNGKTRVAYASLKSDYMLGKMAISIDAGGDQGNQTDERLRTNIPPVIELEGDKHRSVRVGEPLTLTAFVNDPDNLPARIDGRWQSRRRETNSQTETGPGQTGRVGRELGAPRETSTPIAAVYRPPTGTMAPQSPAGLRLSWIVYRNKATAVTFSPEQLKTWTDTRPYANSPWSPGVVIPEPPPDGKWVVRATFQAPGTYVLRAVASDSSLFTYENVTVSVKP
jgi:hypothetical protein